MMVEDLESPEGNESHIETGSLGLVIDKGCYTAIFYYYDLISEADFHQKDANVEILERHTLKYWNLDKYGNEL